MINFSQMENSELVHRLELAQAVLLHRAEAEIEELNRAVIPKCETYDFAIVRFRAGYLMATGYALDIVQRKEIGANFKIFCARISKEHSDECKIFI